MKTVYGNYVSSDGKDHYDVVLNLSTGEYIRVKNAGCSAVSEKLACEYFGVPCNGLTYKTIKVFYQGADENLNMNMIPKKYHRYFRENV